MADNEEWSANSTEAFNISLVKSVENGTKTLATFNPRFTYPIFGDEEQIFGYKDLQINLRYRANDMRPNLQVNYGKKFKAIGDTEPLDIKSQLSEHLPPVAFQSSKDFDSTLADLPETWQPPAEVHSSFDTAEGTYEIRKGSLTDPAIQQLINRIEIFVPLFIEGGSYIGRQLGADDPWKTPEDAARWTVFLMYRKSGADYTFVGYSTVYRFWFLQAPTPPSSPKKTDWVLPAGDFDIADLPSRTRLSQFVILPPFQGKGIGARLYKTIFEHYHSNPNTIEFTVEDPNEAFDDMRDMADLTYLRTVPDFAKVEVNTGIALPRDKSSAVPRDIIDPELLKSLRRQTKIAPRQFARLIEMHTMSQLPASVQPGFVESKPVPSKADEHQYRLWQLLTKQRVYRQNKDLLGQIELPERLEKLNDALASVELEYARLLAAHVRWAKHYESLEAGPNSKRKLPAGAEDQGSAKKARVEDA